MLIFIFVVNVIARNIWVFNVSKATFNIFEQQIRGDPYRAISAFDNTRRARALLEFFGDDAKFYYVKKPNRRRALVDEG